MRSMRPSSRNATAQAVLARIAPELAQRQRGRHRPQLDRDRQAQDLSLMGARVTDVERPAHHRLDGRVVRALSGHIEPGVLQVADPQGEAESQE